MEGVGKKNDSADQSKAAQPPAVLQWQRFSQAPDAFLHSSSALPSSLADLSTTHSPIPAATISGDASSSPIPAPAHPPYPSIDTTTMSPTTPTMPVQDTQSYRRALRKVCYGDINKFRCQNMVFCSRRGNYHLCPTFVEEGVCGHGGIGTIHMGGIHSDPECRARRQGGCDRPGCYKADRIQLLHAKASCFSFRKNPLNPVCNKPPGLCQQGHDNPNIRRALAQSY